MAAGTADPAPVEHLRPERWSRRWNGCPPRPDRRPDAAGTGKETPAADTMPPPTPGKMPAPPPPPCCTCTGLPDDHDPGATLLPYRTDSRPGDGAPWEIGAAPMTTRRTLQHDSPAALLHLHRPAR